MPRYIAGPCPPHREISASEKQPDRRLRIGGAWVSAASGLPLTGHAIRPLPVARLVAAALRRPGRFAALVALLARTPTEHVVLSNTTAGRALGEYFSLRAMGAVPRKRLCRAVLVLPDEHATYLSGRRRKTVRRNLRRAAAAGIRCEVVSNRRSAFDDISHVLRHHPRSPIDPSFQAVADKVHAIARRAETTVVVARDEDGRPVAIMTCVIDEVVCVITAAVAISREPRWALHDHLVRLLITRRVRYLLGDGEGPFGALGFTRSVQHYQHLLGYELRHVVPASPPRVTPRRRLAASLALAAAASVAVVVPRAAASTVTPDPVARITPHGALWARAVPVFGVGRETPTITGLRGWSIVQVMRSPHRTIGGRRALRQDLEWRAQWF